MAEEVCLITGGRGFVGRHLTKRLLEEGGWIVRITDMAPRLLLTRDEATGPLPAALKGGKAEYLKADVTNEKELLEACRGVSVVFHMAAPNPNASDFNVQYEVNVNGTREVLRASLKAGVKRFIYTSSASVVFNGLFDIKDGDETLPYPEKHMDAYGETKAEAEQIVMRNNGAQGLRTIALRPSGVFGPGDPQFVPTLCENAIGGRLKFIIGDGENKMDFTYVDNVVHAHILAEKALRHVVADPEEDPSGKVYFITNVEPVKFWEFVGDIIQPLGYSRPSIKLPARHLISLATIVQNASTKLGLPPSAFTPSRLRISSRWRTFSCRRAEKLLGYKPVVPLKAGVKTTVDYFYPECSYDALSRARIAIRKTKAKTSPSKVHAVLGGGKVADAVLWRDVRMSSSVLGAVLALYWLFFVSGRSFISVAADAVIYLYIALAAYIFVSSIARSRFGLSLPEIPREIPEHHIKSVAPKVAYHYNNNVYPHMHRMFVEKDVTLFAQVAGGLYFLRYLGYFHTSTLVLLGIFFVFAVLPFYDRYEHHVDAIAQRGMEHAKALHGQARNKFMETYSTSYEKLTRTQATANEKLTQAQAIAHEKVAQAHATASEHLTKLSGTVAPPDSANHKLIDDRVDASTPTK